MSGLVRLLFCGAYEWTRLGRAAGDYRRPCGLRSTLAHRDCVGMPAPRRAAPSDYTVLIAVVIGASRESLRNEDFILKETFTIEIQASSRKGVTNA